MAIGGIPHYLRQVEKGKSSTQIINSLCFHKDGVLIRDKGRGGLQWKVAAREG